VSIVTEKAIQVVMTDDEILRYQEWLKYRKLHLFMIPGLDASDLPTYGVGIDDDHPYIRGRTGIECHSLDHNDEHGCSRVGCWKARGQGEEVIDD